MRRRISRLSRSLGLLDQICRQHALEPELQGWATVQFVRDVLPALRSRGDVDLTVVGEPLPYEEVDEAPVVHISTHDLAEADRGDARGPDDGISAHDWFGLGIEVTVGGALVPLPDLLTALARQEQHLLRPDGSWFALDTPELHTLRRLVEEARALPDHEGRPGRLRIKRFQAGLWEELVELGVVGEQSERWQRTVGALLALEEVPHPDPPEGLAATLRPYQLDGYRWLSFLWEHELGGDASPTTWAWARPSRPSPRPSGPASRACSPPSGRCSWSPPPAWSALGPGRRRGSRHTFRSRR